LLITGERRGHVNLWDIETGECVHEHTGCARAIWNSQGTRCVISLFKKPSRSSVQKKKTKNACNVLFFNSLLTVSLAQLFPFYVFRLDPLDSFLESVYSAFCMIKTLKGDPCEF
jgi:hypothetical protein